MLLVVSGDGKPHTNFHDAGKPFGWWDVVHSNWQATVVVIAIERLRELTAHSLLDAKIGLLQSSPSDRRPFEGPTRRTEGTLYPDWWPHETSHKAVSPAQILFASDREVHSKSWPH